MEATSCSPPHTPPASLPQNPPLNQTPLVHKAVTQEFSHDAAKKMKRVYENLCVETKGHFHVGIDPNDFLDKLLPWNDTTPDEYREKAPSKKRIQLLQSVPPKKGQLESSMYKPFVDALDKYVTKNSLKRIDIEKPQTLRFLHSPQPDLFCESLNVDVSTYSEEDLPGCTTFSYQQTHEEFKPDLIHDAFQHELDEKPDVKTKGGAKAQRNSTRKSKETSQAVDVGDDESNEEEDGGERIGEDGRERIEEDDEDGIQQSKEQETNTNCGGSQCEAESEHGTGEERDGGEMEEREQSTVEPKGAQLIAPALLDVQEEDLPFIGDVPNPSPAKPIGHRLAETDTVDGIHTRGQITAYAGLALSMNFRKHFFSMLILGRYARFIRWDRRGAIVTYRFDYIKRPQLIFEFYRRYGQPSVIQKGFDPTATRKVLTEPYQKAFDKYYEIYGGGDFSKKPPNPQPVRQGCFHVTVKDGASGVSETFVTPPPRYSRSYLMPFARGTKRSLACLYLGERKPGGMFFLKDSWQEDSARTEREADIYRRLEAANVQHVATMRLGGDVDNMLTESQNWLDPRFGRMICHRIVLKTIARSLSTFTWCKVLLSCIADAIEASQQAYKAGILHRDLSAGNIMIVRNKETQEWSGILIDWDMCTLWQNHVGETRSGRTGTWAFISAKILLSPRYHSPHTLWDDMESAFWVLFYHVLCYTRHDLGPQELFSELELVFSDAKRGVDGSLKGGKGKVSKILACATNRSSDIAKFKVFGLFKLLNQLGSAFNYRYGYDGGDEEDEEDADYYADDADNSVNKNSNVNGATQAIYNGNHNEDDFKPKDAGYINLDDPDEKWFPNLLRETALKMKPYDVTPRALMSPTNDSRPPKDPKDWKSADVTKRNDFFPMPWIGTIGASSRQQNKEFSNVDQYRINHIDGISNANSSKRSQISEAVDEEEPLRKKQRMQSALEGRKNANQ